MTSLAAAAGSRRPFAPALALLLKGWDYLAQGLIISLMTAMVAIVITQVFLRYVLNSSIGWADEISRLTFVWVIFLALPLGVKAGVHLGIPVLVQRLPAILQQRLVRAVAASSAALLLLVCYEASLISYAQWDEKMASTSLSAAWFVLAVAVGSAHTVLHLLWIALTGAPSGVTDTAAGAK